MVPYQQELHAQRVERLGRMKAWQAGVPIVPIERVRRPEPLPPPIEITPAPKPEIIPPPPPFQLESVTPGALRIEHIQRYVAQKYDCRRFDIISECRSYKYTKARQIAAHLSRRLLAKPLLTLGRSFNRDHTTILHSLRKVEHEMLKSPAFRQDIKAMEDELKPYVKGHEE